MNPGYTKIDRGSIKLTESPEKVAWTIRQKLDLAFDIQRKWSVGKPALDKFIDIFEKQGILVLQHGFPENEISGFSLGENEKPAVIVINSRDVYSRRTFTLFHEYCHLLLDKSGICKIREDSISFERNDKIEKYCDKFASEILVPQAIFRGRPEIGNIRGRNDDENAIRKLANSFKVSRQVILLRLLFSNFISQDYYDEKKMKFDNEYREFIRKKKERERKNSGGPQPYHMAILEKGRLFSKTAVEAFRTGKISNKDVAGYLGVKLKHIPTIESML